MINPPSLPFFLDPSQLISLFLIPPFIYHRPIPILEAADDGDEDPEVDLNPLLQQPDMVMYTPAKMIVLRNPDKAVSVGVSATAASMMGRPDQSNRNNDGKRCFMECGVL